MNEIRVTFAVTGRTIHRAINGNLVLRGYRWEYV